MPWPRSLAHTMTKIISTFAAGSDTITHELIEEEPTPHRINAGNENVKKRREATTNNWLKKKNENQVKKAVGFVYVYPTALALTDNVVPVKRARKRERKERRCEEQRGEFERRS